MRRHPDVRRLEQELARVQGSYQHSRKLARIASDPAVQQAQMALTNVRVQFDATRQAVRQELLNEYRSTATRSLTAAANIVGAGRAQGSVNPEEDVVFLTRKIRILQQYQKQLKSDMAKIDKDARALNDNSLDLESTRTEIVSLEETSRQINSEFQRLKLELDTPGRVSLYERATVAYPLSLKKKFFMTGLAGLGTLGLILVGFAWSDASTRRVGRVDDVVEGLGMNLVGVLPSLPSGRARRTNAASWEHLLMESVDATRTMLLHASRTERIRIIMVTSAVKGEGKTSLASHLSTSLARARQRTLLIDGDLRSPTLHALFDLPRGPGLAELLREEADLTDTLQATPASNLTLITGGQVDPEAIAALAEGRLQEILNVVRDQYDFIIIDSPPCCQWLTRCRCRSTSMRSSFRCFVKLAGCPRSTLPMKGWPIST